MSAMGSRGRKAEMLEQAFAGRSLWADARARLFRNKAAVTSMVVLAAITLLAIFAPYVSRYPYNAIDYNIVACAPDWWPIPAACTAGGTHWFGTDSVGRDLFVRVLYGARVSLAVGFVATFVSLVIGVLYGAIAGYVGGRVDAVMMRAVDILYSLPFIFFVIILMVLFDRNFFLLFVAIGAVVWLTMARIVRGQTLSAKEKEYIEAARAAGVSGFGIIAPAYHPQCGGAGGGLCHLDRAGRDFDRELPLLSGAGHSGAFDQLGVLISDGANTMNSAPWMLIFPALVMGITLFCFNFIGDGLRDALDPKDY